MFNTRITKMLGIKYPIIQGGMVWVSGSKLAAAASNAGCLGVIGAGSMQPELLKQHLEKALSLTSKPIAVNIPLFYKKTEEQMNVALDAGIKIFITSAGSPKTSTPYLKQKGCTVIHAVSTPEFALKCQDAGVDAIIAEGFEAGGHNGRDELTTLVLMQQLKNKLNIPIICAGGIGSGDAILAAQCLNADAVQIGTLFAATQESSAHLNFKLAMCNAKFNSTFLKMKKLMPVRLLDNQFSEKISEAENRCAGKEELEGILGKGRAKLGMHDGDLTEGELEIGQIVSEIKEIITCEELVQRLVQEYEIAKEKLFLNR